MHRPTCGLVAISLSVLACTSAKNVARTRAAYDFQCLEANVDVAEISPGTVIVNACGHRATYSCPGGGRSEPVCIRESNDP